MCKGSYYREKLSGNSLLRCYEVAPPRIRRYLEAEIRFLISNLNGRRLTLELGCGYGRVMKEVSKFVSWIHGIDIAKNNLEMARSYLSNCENIDFSSVDGSQLAFGEGFFDAVFCVQNGMSAFGVDKKKLIAESVRVTKNNGIVIFSSYSPKIWDARLEWFRIQSHFGLVGEIDEEKTDDGIIICKDGFRSTTISDEEFLELFSEQGLNASIEEVDESSIFCSVVKE